MKYNCPLHTGVHSDGGGMWLPRTSGVMCKREDYAMQLISEGCAATTTAVGAGGFGSLLAAIADRCPPSRSVPAANRLN